MKANQGNAVAVKAALSNIIPHAFGEHENCPDWCQRTPNGAHNYTYFKDGDCLSDDNLRRKLEKIIAPFENNSEQIAPCASSQANESFNNTACSKHPKSAYYGGSESHAVRVAVAVCQKNLGYEFILDIFKKLDLSPGKCTKAFRSKKEEKKRHEYSIRKQVPFKRRRLALKKQRAAKNYRHETSEGISYQSGSGYLNTSELIDETPMSGTKRQLLGYQCSRLLD